MLSSGIILAGAGQAKKNFRAVTYTARNLARSIEGIGFKPDVAIIKDLVNTNRTLLCGLSLNTGTPSPFEPYPSRRLDISVSTDLYFDDGNGLTSFDADGFSVSAADEVCKTAVSTQNFGAWLFNRHPDFFSLLNWDGDGNPSQVLAHGLTSTPKMIWAAKREAADDVKVYHASNTANPETDYLRLNSTAATADLDTVWNDTAPDGTNITVGSLLNVTATKYFGCCFAEQVGKSKFGTYTGNGSATGPIISGLGFTPFAVLIKRTDSGGSWRLYDRNRTNGSEYFSVRLNSTGPASSGVDVDLQADGFQPQTTNGDVNANTATYVYAAFA